MTKIYWGKWVDTIPIVSKILPGGGNYLFAVGGSGGIGNDSLVEVVKFNSKNGKIAWTRIIQSKFGLKDIYTSCVSDTINRRIYIGGAVSLDATLKNTAAALWILNYNGTVLDTFYDKGTFPSNNKVNDLLALPNGDVLIAGQVSYNDYQAATLYRYHYTTHKIIDGNITKNDKATPLANTKVYAVSFSAKDSSLHAVDSTISDIKGSYILPVPDTLTNVYVKAAPSLSSYPNQMPTYADSSLFFRNAAVVKMVNDTEYKNFSTILGINPGGNGFIRGLISQGANKVGDPIEHIQVFLMNNNNAPIVSAVTNTSGNFSCADLPIETYKIFVDVPTVDNTRPPVITLTPKDSDMSKLTFLLHRNYLELVKSNGINETSAPENDFNIYPNPFNNQINITYHLSQRAQVSIDLINMQTGSIVKELENNTLPAGEYNKSYNLSSAGLAPGLYILKLMAGDRSSFQIMEKL